MNSSPWRKVKLLLPACLYTAARTGFASRHRGSSSARFWVESSRRRSAPQVLAPTGWRRCLARARPPRARGRRRQGQRRKGRERGALPALACSRTARVTGRCVREAPAAGSTDGRARAAARGVRVRVGGPGRREERADGPRGPRRTHAHSLPEEPSLRLLFLGQTESGSVSPPSAHSPRVSPRGDCSSSAPPAPAPLRGGRRRRDPRSRFVCSPKRGGGATT